MPVEQSWHTDTDPDELLGAGSERLDKRRSRALKGIEKPTSRVRRFHAEFVDDIAITVDGDSEDLRPANIKTESYRHSLQTLTAP
jgi:hypothetical protein